MSLIWFINVFQYFSGVDPLIITVRCGEWNTDIKDEKSVDIEAKSIMIHPEFQNETNYNDFAIIFLKEEFDSTSHPHISPMCLPEQDNDDDISKVSWYGTYLNIFYDKGASSH